MWCHLCRLLNWQEQVARTPSFYLLPGSNLRRFLGRHVNLFVLRDTSNNWHTGGNSGTINHLHCDCPLQRSRRFYNILSHCWCPKILLLKSTWLWLTGILATSSVIFVWSVVTLAALVGLLNNPLEKWLKWVEGWGEIIQQLNCGYKEHNVISNPCFIFSQNIWINKYNKTFR